MVSNMMRRTAAALILGWLLSASGAVSAAPAPGSAADHTVRMVHWWAEYRAAVPASPSRPPLVPRETGQPSLRQRYDASFAPAGLQDVAAASFARVQGKLSTADAAALRGYRLRVQRCSPEGAALLTRVSVADKAICIAPILLASIFFESVGTRLERLFGQLSAAGIDPGSFAGDYDPRLNQRGITRADWDSMLGGYEREWGGIQGASDYLVAYLVECDLLGRAGESCASQAASLARAAGGSLQIDALQSVLANASGRYDPSSWGFRKAGDGEAVARELMAVQPGSAAR